MAAEPYQDRKAPRELSSPPRSCIALVSDHASLDSPTILGGIEDLNGRPILQIMNRPDPESLREPAVSIAKPNHIGRPKSASSGVLGFTFTRPPNPASSMRLTRDVGRTQLPIERNEGDAVLQSNPSIVDAKMF